MLEGNLKPVKILLVEDNHQDIEIIQRVFAEGRVSNELIVMRDGQEALDYLCRRGRFQEPATSPRPGMILLDLNLPKIDGIGVLQQIKQDGDLKKIPVIVITGSRQREDAVRSNDLGVNVYMIQKPVNLESLMRVVSSINEYRILIAAPPLDSA